MATPAVNWSWNLLTTTSGSGSHRVARRGPSSVVAPSVGNASGTDYAQGAQPVWTPSAAATPPMTLPDGAGNNYVFAFWLIRAGTTGGVPLASSIINSSGGFTVPVGDDGNATATAYFVWDFGQGGGANGVYIDAVNADTGFIADDFVNIFPEDGLSHSEPNSLYWKANDGYLNTDTDVVQEEKLSAFDPNGQAWVTWIPIPSLTWPTQNGPTITGRDIRIMPQCRLVAFAVYSTLSKGPILRPPHYEIYDIWWWIKTHGGLVPPGPNDPFGPWMLQYLAALALAETAGIVSPQLKRNVLQLALEQVSLTEKLIQHELRGP